MLAAKISEVQWLKARPIQEPYLSLQGALHEEGWAGQLGPVSPHVQRVQSPGLPEA